MTAVSYGLGKLMAKTPSSSGLTGSSDGTRLDNSRDILKAGRIIYGRDRVGCCIRLRHTAGTNGEYLYLIAAWAWHECDAIEHEFFGDEELTFDGNGNATGTYAGFIRRTHHLGAWDQTADANFVAEIPTIWTTDHRGRGICYTAYRFKWDQNKFPGGLQPLTAVIRGRKIYDAGDEDQDIDDPTTWAWSANSALCEADYLRGVPFLNGDGDVVRLLGLRLPDERVNADILLASANACNEDVPLAVGGSENRYETHGSFDCDSDHPSVIASLESAMAGRTLFIAGEAHIRAGYWTPPDFELTEAMLRRGQRRTRNPLSRREKFNLVSGSFKSPDDNWQSVPFPAVWSETFRTEDGGELAKQMDLPFTASSTMAQRLVRIAMLRARQGIVYEAPYNLKALPALTGENVTITRDRLGWDEKPFEVVNLKFSMEKGDRGGVGFALDIVGQETDSSIFDWNTSLEQAFDPAPNTTLRNPKTVLTPTGLALSTSNFVQSDGTIAPRLRLVWNAPADQFVLAGGFIEIEYKKHADSTWLSWAALRGDLTEDYITDVQTGVAYDVRIRCKNQNGACGSYQTVEDYTIVADTNAPAAPTGLGVTAGPGSNTLDWADNAETDFDYYRVYRYGSNNPGAASVIAVCRSSRFIDTLVTAGTAYWYWVAAVDTTNNESAKSSGAPGTPTAPAGNWMDYRFKQSAAQPDTPTGDNPEGWSDAPTDNPCWIVRGWKNSSNHLIDAWSTPKLVTGPGGDDGLDGDSIQLEYSVDGSTDWHYPFESGDLYGHERIGSGSWSDAYRMIGEKGDKGDAGGTPCAPPGVTSNYPSTPRTCIVSRPSSWPTGCVVHWQAAGSSTTHSFIAADQASSGTIGVDADTVISAWCTAPGYTQSDLVQHCWNDDA
jgi:hypothetical protein